MKKRSLLVLILLSISIGLNAQTLQEKLALKLAKKIEANRKKNGKGPVGTETLDPNVSQSVMASKWESKEYQKYRPDVRTPESKGVKVRVENKDGKVSSIWLGDMEYRADEYGKSDFVRYYKTTGSGHYQVVFMSNKIVVFTTAGSGQLSQKYYLNKPGKYQDVKAAGTYVENSKVNQEADLALYAKNEKANADKAYAAKEAEWSIKGKNVTKIEVTDVKAQYGFGYYRPFSFQIKATLANGKTISTKDGGFWSDYTIMYKNAAVKNKTIQDTKFIKGDKIVIEVKSKFDGSIKGTGKAIMEYGETLTMGNNANNWGESAANYTVEVKQMPHAVTGKPILLFKVTDHSGYQPILYFKMDANKTLNFYANGHNGYKTVNNGHDNGHGANAGNGGNITIIKDPSVKTFNINYTNRGGTGGAGVGYGYNRGADGRDGVYKEIVRAVSF